MVTEDLFDGFGLGDVAKLGRGSVRVDIADVIWVDTALSQRFAHGADRALAFGVRRGEVVHVRARAVSRDLSKDASSAFLSEFMSSSTSITEPSLITNPS